MQWRIVCGAVLGGIVTVSAGCANYAAPGRAAELGALNADAQRMLTEESLRAETDRKPAATFPAGIAVVRLQAPGYRSRTNQGYGYGRYSIVTTRDIEKDEQFERLSTLPGVRGVVPVSRMLLPRELESDLELRKAALQLQADILMLYTIDTVFHVDENSKPLTLVSLGLFPNRKARVTSTASALFMDARTGYIYGAAEASDQQDQLSNSWDSEDAVDQARLRAEAGAFDRLCGEIEKTWLKIQQGNAPTTQALD
jgi:hypothetical protein